MSVTPDFTGQVYRDTNNGNIWRANSTTPGDWTLEVQDAKLVWTPRNLVVTEYLSFIDYYGALEGITSLTVLNTLLEGAIDLETSTTVTSVSFPNLVSIDPTENFGGEIQLWNHDNLSQVDFSSLVTCAGGILMAQCPMLPSLNLASLVTLGGNFSILTLASLSTVSLPQFLPTNGNDITITQAALNASSVNEILARAVANPAYVSGTINLSLGTSAAPTGQGILDKATLQGRGVVVTTN